MINSVKKKIKKFHPPYDICISSCFAIQLPKKIFLKIAAPTKVFRNFISSSKNCVRVWETMCIRLKLYVIISEYFWCSCWSLLMFFECFYCCWSYLMWFFVTISQTKTSQIFMTKYNKRQAIEVQSFIERTETYGKFSDQTNLKNRSIFGKSKFWVVYNYWLLFNFY